MKLIVACNKLGYIGKGGKIPWKCKEDMQHFKMLTTAADINELIVGRKTFEQCLGGKQLPNRTMYVVGTFYYDLTGVLDDLMYNSHFLPRGATRDIWVIGGKSIYDQLVPFCDEIHMSIINDNTVGDTRWEIPQGYQGKVYYYKFEPDGKHGIRGGISKENKEHAVNDRQGRIVHSPGIRLQGKPTIQASQLAWPRNQEKRKLHSLTDIRQIRKRRLQYGREEPGFNVKAFLQRNHTR